MNWPHFKYTEKQAIRWEKTRVKGKFHWVFVVGLLYLGGWIFLVTSFLGYLHKPSPFQMENLLVNVVLSSFLGVLWGIFTWNISEKLYLEYKCKL